MVPHRGGIIGGVFLVRVPEEESQPHRLIGKLRSGLEFHIDVRLRPLLRAERAVGPGHAVDEQHHVVLDHAKPPRLRISFRSRRIFLALKIPSLIHVRTRAIETGFFVVPEDEADRSIGLDIGAAQHAGDFHHERCAGAVVVCRFTPTMAIHVRAKDIHFLGMRDTDLRTVDLFARTRHRGLTVELAQFCISLFHRVCVHARRHPYSPRPTSSRSGVRRQIRFA